MYSKRFASIVLACFVSVSFCLPAVLAQVPVLISQGVEVFDLESRSGVGDYVVVVGGVTVGAEYLIDRGYTFITVSPELEGATYIMTAMEDEGSTGDDYLTFTVDIPVVVLVATDARQGDPPAWLSADEGWEDQPDLVLQSTDDGTNFFVIRSKEFSAGAVSLGGNADAPAEIAPMYIVIIMAADVTSAVEPSSKLSTTWAELKK